tara:strand:- start:296 stop:685 length:390 start_codon:yes stop_codon:yes gene_type:complete
MSSPQTQGSATNATTTTVPPAVTARGIGKGGKGGKLGIGKFSAKRHRFAGKEPKMGITRPAIRRIARRAGIKRINGDFYEETRGVLKAWLENKLGAALCYTSHARRSTLYPMDVVYALKRHNETIYGYG